MLKPFHPFRFGSGARLLVVAVFAVILSPAAASGAQGTSSAQAGQETLTVSIAGTGIGEVSSDPWGIHCPTVCSAQFADGTIVQLVAEADPDSTLGGFTTTSAAGSGLVCPGLGVGPPTPGLSYCQIPLDASTGNVSVQMTFYLKPLCVVPRIKDRTVAYAKRQTIKSHCVIGNIAHSFSGRVKKGRVISQTPRAGRRLPNETAVFLFVSKGKRSQPIR